MWSTRPATPTWTASWPSRFCRRRKSPNPERKRRFVQEAKAASALNHPNIITIHDIASDSGHDFMVMEFVAGKALDQLIPRKGLRLTEVLKYAVQIADALATAHGAGIVHRDIKPSNIMVTEKGHVKVLDFGLAKLTEPIGPEAETVTARTAEGAIVGTVAYMSPEQAQGKAVDPRSDIFSFGSVLYEMATGRRAFQGDTKISTLAAIINQEPAPPGREVPQELQRIIARCLRKDPARRFQHMEDLNVALEELKEESDSGTLTGVRPAPRRPRRMVAAAGALAVILAAALAWYFLRPAPEPAAALKVAPLTTYPGLETEPSFSPDGNQVAFVWNGEKQDNFDIYVKLIGPGKPLRVTTHPGMDFSPAWSPDGRSIAFLRQLGGGDSGVFLVPALGGPERLVGETRVSRVLYLAKRFLDWSPDGKWLAVCDGSSLSLLSVETGEKQRLTSPLRRQVDYDPAFAPDGGALAFARQVAGFDSQVYQVELTQALMPKGETQPLLSQNRVSSSPVWTPDGREIVFVSGQFGSLNLWKIAARGSGKPRQLTTSEEWACWPAVSRRQNRLVFARQTFNISIWRAEAPRPGASASPPVKLIFSTRVETNPQYSPDGKRIAFQSYRTGSAEIWVCDSDGTNCLQLTSFGGSEGGTPRWSPDGSQLAFDSRVAGHADIYVIRADGSKPRRLTTDPAEDIVPSWSRDGKWVYFASNRSGQRQVWKMPANGGQAVQITKQGGHAAFESADGRVVYYFKDGALWKVPVEGGTETQVLDSLSNWSTFSVVDDGVYYIPRTDPDGSDSIRFLDFKTGKTTPVVRIEKRAHYGLSVSPDRRWILYSQVDQWESDLMLVENFR